MIDSTIDRTPDATLQCVPPLASVLRATAARHRLIFADADLPTQDSAIPQLWQEGGTMHGRYRDNRTAWPLPLRMGTVLDWVVQQQRHSLPIELGAGGMQLQVLARRIVRPGHPDGAEPILLTEKEVAVIVALADAAAPVSRERLLAEVWGYSPEADTHTLETNIYRLRQKLEGAGIGNLLLTGEGGYYLARV